MDIHGRVNVCDYFDHYHSNSFGWGSDLWNWIMSQCYSQHELNLRRWWLYRMVMGIICELFFRIKAFKFDTILSNLKKINLFTKTGFAYVGGACVVNKRLEKVNSVAIIEDTGGFSGIIVAAHEVGHLWVINFNYLSHKSTTKKINCNRLGAVHDGSPPPSYLGGPGAEKCRWEDGYIMSDLRHTERGFRWSACSVQSFHHFLK